MTDQQADDRRSWWRWLRDRFTYANVVSTLAAFFALGGTAYAADQLPKNSVGSPQIRPGGVHSSDIQDHGVTPGDLAFKPLVASDLAGATFNASTTTSLAQVEGWTTVAWTRLSTPQHGLLSLGNVSLTNNGKDTVTVKYRLLVDGKQQGGTLSETLLAGQSMVAPLAIYVPALGSGPHQSQLQVQGGIDATVGPTDFGSIAGIRPLPIG